MASTATHRVDWTLIWSQRGFRFFFLAMFVSLFGSGMNFAGVSWYILTATHSTVKVSWQVIIMTLPGLFVPFLGGVLIDRIDRRYLGVMLDLVRGCFVLATAYIAWSGHLHLWHLYAMTLITGTGSAMYWAAVNALVQEVIPSSQFTGANAAVLVGVQSGMLIAGAFVGFMYNTAGIWGILAIDGATYFVSSYCLYRVRSGYVSPRASQKYPREYNEATEATAEALEIGENPEVAEAGLSLAVYADMKEGFAYLKQQPLVRALGITHAVMMAGVVSANVVLVALANDILHAGPRGLGFLEAGWATGAIIGGLIASQLPGALRMPLYVAVCALLAAGHMATPFVAFLVGAVMMQIAFGFCRALGGVVAQSSLMSIVPRHFMGRTQSAMAILTTVVQLTMSVALGWVAQGAGLVAGYSLLALLYTGSTISAIRARQLMRGDAAPVALSKGGLKMPSLYIILEKEIPGVDIYVNGNILSKYSDQLERTAKQLKVTPLMEFFNMPKDELASFAADHDVDIGESKVLSEGQWFKAEDGLRTIHALLGAISGSKLSDRDRIAAELGEFVRVLELAKTNSIRWHLGVDI
jgi:MFS family permease